MTTKEKIMKIMSLALEINPPEIEDIGQKKTALFVNWSPHCNRFDVRIHYGGWKRDVPSDPDMYLYTNGEDASEKLDEIIETLEKIKEELCG